LRRGGKRRGRTDDFPRYFSTREEVAKKKKGGGKEESIMCHLKLRVTKKTGKKKKGGKNRR